MTAEDDVVAVAVGVSGDTPKDVPEIGGDEVVMEKPKVKRRRGNTLEKWEAALVKAMIRRKQYNDQDILAYFTRPTRTVNHRLIGEIRTGDKHKAVKAADDDELDTFLATWPDVDHETGLSVRGDELLIKAREAMIAAGWPDVPY
jgi:hypothetical protein